jgi:hypothetical protein
MRDNIGMTRNMSKNPNLVADRPILMRVSQQADILRDAGDQLEHLISRLEGSGHTDTVSRDRNPAQSLESLTDDMEGLVRRVQDRVHHLRSILVGGVVREAEDTHREQLARSGSRV